MNKGLEFNGKNVTNIDPRRNWLIPDGSLKPEQIIRATVRAQDYGGSRNG